MIPFITLLASSLFALPRISWHFISPSNQMLSKHSISLEKRYNNTLVNTVFKDNILLDIAYITGNMHMGEKVTWSTLEKPFHYSLVLSPHKTFVFHDAILPDYKDKQLEVAPAHFSISEGFKSDGYLAGDGVCHLASLMYWTAKDAKLEAYAPVRHDFAPIPEIPATYGVAIFNDKTDIPTSEQQNLYITNTYNNLVTITFDYDGKNLGVSITKPQRI